MRDEEGVKPKYQTVWLQFVGDDRERYLAFRKPIRTELLIIGVIFVPFLAWLAYRAYAGLSSPFLSVLFPVVWGLALILRRRSRRLSGIEVVFKKGEFVFYERFGPWESSSRQLIFRTIASWVRSASWASDGLLFNVGSRWWSWNVVIPHQILSTEDAVKIAVDWCEDHGIEIEGVPPLPGGYLRPIEERRGL